MCLGASLVGWGRRSTEGDVNMNQFAAESLAVRIKRLRLASGLTQGQLGALIGISGSAVGRWEMGEYLPKGRYVAKLAQALGIDVATLLGETPTSTDDLAEEVKLLTAFRSLPRERQLIAIKLVQALAPSVEDNDVGEHDDERS